MVFIETATFTRQLLALLDDDCYARMQATLVANPLAGELLVGGGGIRKLRYALPGGGKRGGLRVIYYFAARRAQIYLLVIYPKSAKDDLTAGETAVLRELAKQLAKEVSGNG